MDMLDVSIAKSYVKRSLQGAGALKGDPGFSPTIITTPIDNGHKVNITDINGTQSFDVINGEKGDNGTTPHFTIGDVSTLPYDSKATATITGTSTNPILNLGIPRGKNGDVDCTDFEIRDFNSDPIDLSLETKGTIPKEKIDMEIARLADVLDKTLYKGSKDGVVKLADSIVGISTNQLNDTINDSHSHTNIDILNKIIGNGDGKKFLTDDGTYKNIFVISSIQPSDENCIWIDMSDNSNTILKMFNGTTWIPISGGNINLDEITNEELLNICNGISILNSEDYISQRRLKTYDENIKSYIEQKMEPTSRNVNIQQKSFLNVKNGDVKNININSEFGINGKFIAQIYKLVEGEKNIVQVLKNFDNTDSENFNCNLENVCFGESGMKIKDNYELRTSKYLENLYITEPFNKNDFDYIYNIE